MKFWLINSLRTIVYVSYFAIIIYGVYTGVWNDGEITQALLGVAQTDTLAKVGDIVICGFGGFIVASLVCGLIMTIMDIRDDINDRLPDAHHDN